MKRLIDIIGSGFGLLVLLPAFIVVALIIKVGSTGPVLFKQQRVGKNGKDFKLLKFRTMHEKSHTPSAITVGNRDPRITKSGYWLRKYKLDELPQLINVLVGEMSLVGPRPELRHYVEMYNKEQLKVLTVKPGITDLASIEFSNENELLGSVNNPQEYYEQEIMPKKLAMNLSYIKQQSLLTDLGIIIKTIGKILS